MIDDNVLNSRYYKYALDAVEGNIVVGEYVRLACKRFLNDLERHDLEFRHEIGDKFIKFCSCLKLFEGGSKSVGKPVDEALSDWQMFWVFNLLCFYRKNGKRRFTKCLVNIARKQAKTMVSALLALWFLLFDGEGGPLICLSANSREQAGQDFKFCEAFAQQLDPKEKKIKRYRQQLTTDFNKGRLSVFSSESKNADGYNPSVFIVDEMAGATTTEMVDVWRSGQGARENPMGIIISTAGFDTSSPFYKMIQVGKEVLRGIKEDDSYLYLIYTLDEGDDFRDEHVWNKSMPNLDISVSRDFVREEVNNAINDTQLEVSVKTKTFNLFVSSSSTWINSEFIRKCVSPVKWSDFDENTQLYIGIDLASTGDLTSVAYMFKPEDEDMLYVKHVNYLPEYTLNHSPNSQKYKEWMKRGWLKITQGNVCDYSVVLNDIMEHTQNYCTQKIGYDPWSATQFVINATNEGLPMYPVSQTMVNLTKPTKTLERLIKLGKIVFDVNEITTWCFENTAVKSDWNENIRPIKGGSKEQKIDNVVSTIVALSVYLDFGYSSASLEAI